MCRLFRLLCFLLVFFALASCSKIIPSENSTDVSNGGTKSNNIVPQNNYELSKNAEGYDQTNAIETSNYKIELIESIRTLPEKKFFSPNGENFLVEKEVAGETEGLQVLIFSRENQIFEGFRDLPRIYPHQEEIQWINNENVLLGGQVIFNINTGAKKSIFRNEHFSYDDVELPGSECLFKVHNYKLDYLNGKIAYYVSFTQQLSDTIEQFMGIYIYDISKETGRLAFEMYKPVWNSYSIRKVVWDITGDIYFDIMYCGESKEQGEVAPEVYEVWKYDVSSGKGELFQSGYQIESGSRNGKFIALSRFEMDEHYNVTVSEMLIINFSTGKVVATFFDLTWQGFCWGEDSTYLYCPKDSHMMYISNAESGELIAEINIEKYLGDGRNLVMIWLELGRFNFCIYDESTQLYNFYEVEMVG